MSDVPIYTKAEMDAQLDRISALSAELETVKGERDAYKTEYEGACVDGMKQAARAEAAEAKLAGGEAVDVRHFNILAEAMAEVKATSDGLSDQSIAEIVAGCIEEINALTHPAPTHEDGSGAVIDGELQNYIHRCRELSENGQYSWWSRLADILSSVSHTSGEVTEAMVEAEFWLSGALACKEWHWDADQHEAATDSLERIRALASGGKQ